MGFLIRVSSNMNQHFVSEITEKKNIHQLLFELVFKFHAIISLLKNVFTANVYFSTFSTQFIITIKSFAECSLIWLQHVEHVKRWKMFCFMGAFQRTLPSFQIWNMIKNAGRDFYEKSIFSKIYKSDHTKIKTYFFWCGPISYLLNS